MRVIPKRAVTFVADLEELRLQSYPDSAGVWTIGYGHTGPNVHAGMRITEAQADKWLIEDLKIARARLCSMVDDGAIQALNVEQYVALLSFVFNLGVKPEWKIWGVVNRRQFEAVPGELARFIYAGKGGAKKRIKGLVTRRNAEIALWNEDAEDETPPSSFTREEETPPARIGVKSFFRSKKVQAVGATGALSLTSSLKDGAEQVSPYAGQSDLIATIFTVLTVLAAIASLVTLGVLAWSHFKESKQ